MNDTAESQEITFTLKLRDLEIIVKTSSPKYLDVQNHQSAAMLLKQKLRN
jgi:hypothetical protein